MVCFTDSLTHSCRRNLYRTCLFYIYIYILYIYIKLYISVNTFSYVTQIQGTFNVRILADVLLVMVLLNYGFTFYIFAKIYQLVSYVTMPSTIVILSDNSLLPPTVSSQY